MTPLQRSLLCYSEKLFLTYQAALKLIPLHLNPLKHAVSKRANPLLLSHLKYMNHKEPGEWLSPSVNFGICLKHPQFVFLIPKDWGFVFMEII